MTTKNETLDESTVAVVLRKGELLVLKLHDPGGGLELPLYSELKKLNITKSEVVDTESGRVVLVTGMSGDLPEGGEWVPCAKAQARMARDEADLVSDVLLGAA